jgi:hypothetical protein
MKSLLFIVALFTIVPGRVSGQSFIDSLLPKLNNGQLVSACYNTQETLDTYSQEATMLIKNGKASTRALIPLLTDPEKGIIAHYILVRIWLGNKFTPVQKRRFEPDKTMVCEYFGLTIRQPASGAFSTSQVDLDNNKRLWLRRLPRRFR